MPRAARFGSSPSGRTHLVGVLFIAFREARRFSADDRIAWRVLARDFGKALERARLFVSVQRERSEAQEANRAQDDFLSVSSLGLRAPMGVILGWTERLDQPKVESAWFRRGVCAIRQSVQALETWIDALLEMSRIVTGELKVESRRQELGALVRDGLSGLESEALKRGLELVQAGGNPEAQVVADGVRLRRAIRYFALAALRATPNGARVRVETEVQERLAIVRFRSENDGAEPRGPARAGAVDHARSTEDDSWAGLAIATHIVEQHLGAVNVDRREHGAFVASVELPLARETGGTTGRVSPAAKVEVRSPPLAGSRLLVVTDDADEGDMLAGTLAGLGAHVWQVHSSREALEELRVLAPEAIVSDLSPNADPLGFIRDVRALPAPVATTPAIALTASPREADVRQVLSAGYQRNLPRHPEAHVLTEAIAELRKEVRSGGGPPADEPQQAREDGGT
jgi:CheY-like chemotaxis protein